MVFSVLSLYLYSFIFILFETRNKKEYHICHSQRLSSSEKPCAATVFDISRGMVFLFENAIIMVFHGRSWQKTMGLPPCVYLHSAFWYGKNHNRSQKKP